ncbi:MULTISPECIES: homocysteine S-methyltransferase family protein [unclassified Bradyrhizobium]|uniref:homocysteine S-methyltransferase family protein n=1 Tax=unclassified Bradyrhizobium TaxID=2631580 RepID=UPI001BA8043E|nr:MULTISPECIES: homocysteine S-methyltransferase family protein [unclassified Bradyrhizobium]MBR1223402.1 homocysteine S-methyltransferase family protein [Bradyrhizobium sp. AUGA SZCCT0176]MBR1298833.1 homocysteine S-methyltransferase family protein [Bradyrhizobium sp. AUGA SZCCT0042]
MTKYRYDLPQRRGGIFLTDGGMETTLIFHEGIDLPHFAAFVLLDSEVGRGTLKRYYQAYMAVARDHGVGFVLDSPTWRANPDWGAMLGYDAAALRAINIRGIGLLEELRAEWERPMTPCVVSGAIGPRGDGYKAGNMDAAEAEAYHGAQIAAFVEGGADMVTAYTLTNINEAIGIARAARAQQIPAVISFTVETDGRLVNGGTLREAIEAVDRAVQDSVEYFLVNCAHPTHFEHALKADEAWVKRIHGVRANASTKSHAELDESATLDAGDPQDLGRRYLNLRRSFPAMRILGGCCGTDHRHVAAICDACLPPRALSA